MCCTSRGIYHHHGCMCDSEHSHHFFRRFLGKEERITRLSDYKEELSRELQEVKEHIAALKKEK